MAALNLAAMTRIDLSVPDDLGDWAQARATEAHLGGAGEYVAELLRREREDAEKLARLQAAIDEGRASGISDRTIEDIIADGRRRRAAR